MIARNASEMTSAKSIHFKLRCRCSFKALHHSQSHAAPVARKGKQKDPDANSQTTQEGDKERRAYLNVSIICEYNCNVTDTGMGAVRIRYDREVPRSADYEYEYVWVSRILTR